MNDVVLTRMRQSDIPDVMAIEGQVFTTPWTEAMFRQEVRGVFNSHTIVARLDDQLIGYQIAWFIEEEVHLVNIAVHPDHQSWGVGALMLDRLIDAAITDGMRIVTLEVRESNVDAQRFYRKFSFHVIGIRKSYYSDNREDALLMVLDLEEYQRRAKGNEGTSSAG